MEVIVILANFLAMMFAMVWSARAEKGGGSGGNSGFFAYENIVVSEPAPRSHQKRKRR